MLPPLYDSHRKTLMRMSLVACCVSAALLPLTGGTSTDASAAPSVGDAPVHLPAVPLALRFPPVELGRDPFVPDEVAEPAPVPGDVNVVLPPNAGAAGVQIPTDAAAAPAIVRAVVIGASSRALVDQNGKVTVLGVGDLLNGVQIQSIDAGGVVFVNGDRIRLTVSRP